MESWAPRALTRPRHNPDGPLAGQNLRRTATHLGTVPGWAGRLGVRWHLAAQRWAFLLILSPFVLLYLPYCQPLPLLLLVPLLPPLPPSSSPSSLLALFPAVAILAQTAGSLSRANRCQSGTACCQ